MKSRILITDDDRNFVKHLTEALEGKYDVDSAYSEEEFYKKFKPYSYDLILLDIRLKEDKEGLSLLKFVREENPLLPVVMITAYPDVDSAVEALKMGARDYIQKEKVDMDYLVKIVESIINETKKEKRVQELERMVSYFSGGTEIIGKSRAMEEVREKIKMCADDGEVTVLIRGESGVGKELVARNIHKEGVRKNGPFIAYAIAGAHKGVIDSELFGHEKGAFTGAIEKKRGLLEEANGGILFLDEIGDLPEETQIKLLRVLETKSFRRVGGNYEIRVDLQFVAATNKNLEELVKNGKFREDLYYRLKAFEIYIPPLRERREDIGVLTEYFLNFFTKRKGIKIDGISKEAMEILTSYDWPGNVRELRNVIENAVIIASSRGIKLLTPEVLMIGKGMERSDDRIQPSTIIFPQKEKEIEELNLNKYLAEAELRLIKKGIERFGKKRETLSKELGYPNRFTMIRRVKRIFQKFPELKEEFSDVAKIFKV
jgi:DNA-binding NtrC family response regulator